MITPTMVELAEIKLNARKSEPDYIVLTEKCPGLAKMIDRALFAQYLNRFEGEEVIKNIKTLLKELGDYNHV